MIRILDFLKKFVRSIHRRKDIFVHQQDSIFYSVFPEQPIRPNTLTLGRCCESAHKEAATPISAKADAFWYRLTGHSKGHYSLAIVNRSLASALYRNSHQQASFVPFDNGHHDTTTTLQKNELDRPIVSIVHHYPVITDEAPADIRLIIFFWEESAVPQATISLLNEKFDAILVASTFVTTALRNSGCTKPIFVIPLGIDHLIDDSEPLMPLVFNKGERFRFLHVSSVFERKGPEFLLSAFMAQFTANDPVELYIKTFPNPHNRIREQLSQLSAQFPHAPRVIIDETEVSNETLKALYRSSHTMVLPTRGEGFNLPAAEALALGLPVIVTGYGAHTDFCSTTTSSLIPYRFDLSQSHVNAGDGCWVTPEVRALSVLMQQAVKDVCTNSASLNQRRAAGQALMRSTYSWDHCVQGIANALHYLTAHPEIRLTAEQDFFVHDILLSEVDCLNLVVSYPQVDALVLRWEPSVQDINISEGLIHALSQLSTNDTVLILALSALPDMTKLKLDQTILTIFLKLFSRIIVKNVQDLNKMLAFCPPHKLILLPDAPDSDSSREDQHLRNIRMTDMAKGLKFDLLLSKFNQS